MHKPVLLHEILEYLNVSEDSRIIDATLGFGGHTESFLQKGAAVLAIDTDPRMIEKARERLSAYANSEKLTIVKGNFSQITSLSHEAHFEPVTGILADLGISSVHYDTDDRGFSFQHDTDVLDMRLDPESQSVTAYDLLNALREDQLRTMFGEVMGGLMVTKLASAVVAARTVQPFKTVKDFDDVITSVLRREGHLNEATLPFLALRIAVNTEIQNLKTLITDGFSLLASKGRFAIISFHSLEDHVVKHAFQAYEQRGEGILITHGVVIAKDTEIEGNPRARSAKLRVIEKN